MKVHDNMDMNYYYYTYVISGAHKHRKTSAFISSWLYIPPYKKHPSSYDISINQLKLHVIQNSNIMHLQTKMHCYLDS